MEKKSSIAKDVIYVAVIRWVHIEFVLFTFSWCISLAKFFTIKLPLVCSSPGKLSVSHPGFCWAHLYI